MLRLLLRLIVYGAEGVSKIKGEFSTGTITGTRAKTVKCEKCQVGYVYQVTRKATGPLSSLMEPKRHNVNYILDAVLNSAIEPVPCPSCGWLQADMIPITKGRQKRWMITAGGMTLVVAIVGMLVGVATLTAKSSTAGKWELAGSSLILVVSMGLYAGRAYLVSRFNPNEIAPEIQKAIGQQLSISQEDHEKHRAEAQTQKLDRREQAKRNMANGYGLPQPGEELVRCRYCNHQQEAKNKKCVSCSASMQ